MRLDKLIAQAGMTRSEAKEAISRGRVCVNGIIVRNAGMNAEYSEVTIDGEPVSDEHEIYLMLNKPAGVITATEDRSLPTVMDLLPEKYRRRKIGPVGRLDRDVTGLVIMTTDGVLAHRLISPKWKAEKVYIAKCEGTPDEACVRRFIEGLELKDFTAAPAKLTVLQSGETSTCEVRLTEGKYHEVKRMFSAAGYPLIQLSRVSIGGVALDPQLSPGEFRKLTDEELDMLKIQSEMNGERK